ncbi:unnamed protein product, partial [Polarella glacialis]
AWSRTRHHLAGRISVLCPHVSCTACHLAEEHEGGQEGLEERHGAARAGAQSSAASDGPRAHHRQSRCPRGAGGARGGAERCAQLPTARHGECAEGLSRVFEAERPK